MGANLGTEQSLSFPDHTTTSSYDAVGNRLSSLGVSPNIYNSPNQLTSTPSLTYTYDYNGNTLTKSDGTSYAWDYDNQLKQVTLPGSGGTVNFKDEPFGRRVQKFGPNRTTNYVYDGPNLLEEWTGMKMSLRAIPKGQQSISLSPNFVLERPATTSRMLSVLLLH